MLVLSNSTENPYFEAFVRSLHDRKLRFYASDLQQSLGMLHFDQLDEPIRRAMQVCRSQGLPLEDHFKPIYRCERRNTLCDWKLSSLASGLVLLNGNPAHPEVARMQLALLGNEFGEL